MFGIQIERPRFNAVPVCHPTDTQYAPLEQLTDDAMA